MLELDQSEANELIKSIGDHSWSLYSRLKNLANGSIINMTQEQICAVLGITKKTFNRNIKPLLDYRISDQALIQVVRTVDGNSYLLTEFTVIPGTNVMPAAPSSSPKKTSPTNELFDYWLQNYEVTYGVPYSVSNFGKEKGHIRTLADRYGGDVELVKAIMDVVIRLYPSRWKSAQFIRPTLGALVSWLAMQAEPMARANQTASDPEIVIIEQDGENIFDVYDRAWGMKHD